MLAAAGRVLSNLDNELMGVNFPFRGFTSVILSRASICGWCSIVYLRLAGCFDDLLPPCWRFDDLLPFFVFR